MGAIFLHPDKVKLFCGFLGRDPELIEQAVRLLEKKFGPEDTRSELMDFSWTDYYTEEMGPGLKRLFVSFRKLIDRERIADIKHFTNRLEGKLSQDPEKRGINIDPGFLGLPNVCLATTKDHQHRVYIGKGIFLENTLRFMNGKFMDWEWTYPDYRSENYKAWFSLLREIYRSQIHTKKPDKT
jgi:hypothetical protein